MSATVFDPVTQALVAVTNGTPFPAGSDLSMGVHKLTNVVDPAGAQDAATKAYADTKLAKSTATAKGDLYIATGSGVVVRLPVGIDGKVLTADAASTGGVKWA